MEQDYLEEEQLSRRKRNRGTDKKTKKRKLWPSIVFGILAIILIIGALQVPKILAILQTFDNVELDTGTENKNTLGLLILGMDNDGGDNTQAGHTDSITYIAANLEKKKAYALPIYRDANIVDSCTGGTENINRIYAQSGVSCLASSTTELLNLPIDNYVMITMDGFIEIINEFGTLSITPTDTFCSNYGIDRTNNYCFTKGVTEDMNADQAMAYLRYRASGNGESRANRQVEIIRAVKDRCMGNVWDCYNKVSPHFSNALTTNLGVSEITVLMDIFGSNFDLETLSVLEGENVELSAGNWTQYLNEDDKAIKTEIIRQEIFA